jgi:hypothetical protein
MNIILLYRVLISDFFNSKNSVLHVGNGMAAQDVTRVDKKNGFHTLDTMIVRSMGDDHAAVNKFQ